MDDAAAYLTALAQKALRQALGNANFRCSAWKKVEEFLREFKKKSGKSIGERTIHGIITLAKFIEPSKANEPLELLQNRYKNYLTD